jgi:hypothetical protein
MRKVTISLNILAFLAGSLMVVAMFLPWWSITLQAMGRTDLYPYLIDGPIREILGYKKSPQMALLTNLFIACIVFCVSGSLLRGWIARLMLGISGIVVLLACRRFLIRIEEVAERFDVPIQGHGFGSYLGFGVTEVWTELQLGVYLMIAGGVLAMIAAIIQNKVRIKLL